MKGQEQRQGKIKRMGRSELKRDERRVYKEDERI